MKPLWLVEGKEESRRWLSGMDDGDRTKEMGVRAVSSDGESREPWSSSA